MAELAGLEPLDIPVAVQWQYNVNVNGLRGMVKGLRRPLYCRYMHKGTGFHFKKPGPD